MKKTLAFLFAGLLSAVAFAGKDNVVITFSTPGPDKYADGSLVEKGEIYALVWTPTGSTFEGIGADGQALGDSKVVIKAPVAVGHHCPLVQFQIDQTYRASNYPDGSWGVYLLDTRVYEADENGVVLKDADGKAILKSVGGTAVNGYSAGKVAEGQFVTASANEVLKAETQSKIKEGSLKITGIKLVDGYVYVFADGAVPGFAYGIKSADTPQGVESAEAVPQYLTEREGKQVFITPQSESGSGFIKLGR